MGHLLISTFPCQCTNYETNSAHSNEGAGLRLTLFPLKLFQGAEVNMYAHLRYAISMRTSPSHCSPSPKGRCVPKGGLAQLHNCALCCTHTSSMAPNAGGERLP